MTGGMGRKMEPYYYNHMSKQERAAYYAMKEGLTSLAPSFRAPGLKVRELSDIFFKLRLDCPEIFYGVGFRCRSYPDSPSVEILPEYEDPDAQQSHGGQAVKACAPHGGKG